MSSRAPAFLLCLLCAAPALAQTDWRTRVSPDERDHANPVAGQPAAIEAGARQYAESCAKCHGDDANGKGGRPGLRTDRVAGETDGEVFWILKNGARWRGMPAWAGLGDTKLWELVSYLRSMRPASTPAVGAPTR